MRAEPKMASQPLPSFSPARLPFTPAGDSLRPTVGLHRPPVLRNREPGRLEPNLADGKWKPGHGTSVS